MGCKTHSLSQPPFPLQKPPLLFGAVPPPHLYQELGAQIWRWDLCSRPGQSTLAAPPPPQQLVQGWACDLRRIQSERVAGLLRELPGSSHSFPDVFEDEGCEARTAKWGKEEEGMVLLSRVHSAMCRDISGCHNLKEEGRDI